MREKWERQERKDSEKEGKHRERRKKVTSRSTE